MKIDGATAVVTGGARGLGLAIARRLRTSGARVFVFDRDVEALKALPTDIVGLVVDVTKPEQVEGAVSEVAAQTGQIAILVNNAGVIHSESFVNIMAPDNMMHDYMRFRDSLLLNLDSVFIVTSAVVRRMVLGRVKGTVVNISSISACGNQGQVAYSAAKAGVSAMTVTLSKELGRLGIRCNCIAPGFTDTESTRKALSETELCHVKDSTPLRRLGTADEVAHAVAAVVENDFINGAVIRVDGGLRI